MIYRGDFRDVTPLLDKVDLILTDPPYGQTSLKWDRWQTGWCEHAARALKTTGSVWCFGTLRMFMIHAAEFFDAADRLHAGIAEIVDQHKLVIILEQLDIGVRGNVTRAASNKNLPHGLIPLAAAYSLTKFCISFSCSPIDFSSAIWVRQRSRLCEACFVLK